MRCQQCGNHLVQRAGDQVRLRVEGPITFDQAGVCRGKCYWCKAVVALPLQLTLPAGQPMPGETLQVPAGASGTGRRRIVRTQPGAEKGRSLDEPGGDRVG